MPGGERAWRRGRRAPPTPSSRRRATSSRELAERLRQVAAEWSRECLADHARPRRRAPAGAAVARAFPTDRCGRERARRRPSPSCSAPLRRRSAGTRWCWSGWSPSAFPGSATTPGTSRSPGPRPTPSPRCSPASSSAPRCSPRRCWCCSAVSSPTATTRAGCWSPGSSARPSCWSRRRSRWSSGVHGAPILLAIAVSFGVASGLTLPVRHGAGAADRAGDDLGTVQGWNQISSRAMKLLGAPVGGVLVAWGGPVAVDAGRCGDLRGDRGGARRSSYARATGCPGPPTTGGATRSPTGSSTSAATTRRSSSWSA